MDKRERLECVLAGEQPDRPPVSLWYHLGVQHAGGLRVAELALDYFDFYDFDWLKLMNDFHHPLPEGCEEIASAADLQRIGPVDPGTGEWGQQIAAVKAVAQRLGGRAAFVDTIFDPWTTLRRLAGQHTERLRRAHPHEVNAALAAITANLIAYAERSLQAGAHGIFLSIPAERSAMDVQEFRTFVRPYDMQLLAAIAEPARMNIAHVHGDALYFEEVLDYPAQVFNWFDRGTQTPSLGEIKSRISGAVMGGVDHMRINTLTLPGLRAHVEEGLREGGTKRFLLAGGCSIASETHPAALRSVVDAAKAIAGLR